MNRRIVGYVLPSPARSPAKARTAKLLNHWGGKANKPSQLCALLPTNKSNCWEYLQFNHGILVVELEHLARLG
jgi:hypothetical protein